MPSFISSFRTLPHGWRSLAIAVGFALCALAGIEMFWRARGFHPTLTNTSWLWCETRGRVASNGVVILGSSRLQTGLDPVVLSDTLGGRPVSQLAIVGANPIPALLDLANDASFNGVVLFEYMPRRLFTPDFGSTERTAAFVASCRDPSVIAPIEAKLERELEQRLVILNDDLQFVALASFFAHHKRLPRHESERLRPDRFTEMLFPEDEHTPHAPDVWDAPFTGTAFEEHLHELHDAIAKIKARGGKVVLYRSPISHDILADEEARFPANVWLERTARALDVPAIDYATLPGLPPVDTPDGEHPRARDVPALTRVVGQALASLLATER